tara:strand:- start:588 stop:887 length:300 start_codon:yes stop_codon:yes gene_type:complete
MPKNKPNNFNKKEISKKISKNTGLPISYTSEIVDDFIVNLKIQIKSKETIIKNFAKFKVMEKSERIGRNPRNNKAYKIAKAKTLSFIVSKILSKKIKNL